MLLVHSVSPERFAMMNEVVHVEHKTKQKANGYLEKKNIEKKKKEKKSYEKAKQNYFFVEKKTRNHENR